MAKYYVTRSLLYDYVVLYGFWGVLYVKGVCSFIPQLSILWHSLQIELRDLGV